MTELLLYFISSILFTSIIFRFLLIGKNGKLLNIYDHPNERKIHNKKTLKIVGIGILFSSLFILCAYRLINEEYFFKMTLIVGQILISTIFLVMGALVDDIVSINAPKKLFFQITAILIIIKSGFFFSLFPNYYLNVLFSIGFYVLVINSMNLIDGIDGLSTSIFILFSVSAIIVSTSLFALDPKYYILIVIFIGSIISFLFLNFPPAKIFLGDTGSQLLGWILAVSIVYLSSFFKYDYQKIYLLSFISLPLYDVIFVMIKRCYVASGNIFKIISRVVYPDQNHIHHLILKSGFSPLQSMVIIVSFYALCLVLAIFPILFSAYYFIVFIIVLMMNIFFRLFFEIRSV